MAILGIDYGEKRVGLALAESPIDLPLPYKMIENKDESALLNEIKTIVEDEFVTEIVVGLPIKESGEPGTGAAEISKFVEHLKERFKETKVMTIDERYTSRLADSLSLEQGVQRDVGSAMIILDDYLKRLTSDQKL